MLEAACGGDIVAINNVFEKAKQSKEINKFEMLKIKSELQLCTGQSLINERVHALIGPHRAYVH